MWFEFKCFAILVTKIPGILVSFLISFFKSTVLRYYDDRVDMYITLLRLVVT